MSVAEASDLDLGLDSDLGLALDRAPRPLFCFLRGLLRVLLRVFLRRLRVARPVLLAPFAESGVAPPSIARESAAPLSASFPAAWLGLEAPPLTAGRVGCGWGAGRSCSYVCAHTPGKCIASSHTNA